MVAICIVGGGPGGLLTAHHLLKKEPACNITIYEATPDVGGKILTKHFKSAPAMFEAGVAELYHPKKFEDSLLNLLKQFDFKFIKMAGDVAIYKGRIIPNIDALRNVVSESCWKNITQFIELGKKYRSPEEFSSAGWPKDNQHPWANLTLREVLDKHIPHEDAKNFFEKIIKSDLATEPGVTNGTYGFDNYLVDEPDYCQIYTISTGISGLVDALTDELEGRCQVLVDTPVRSIRKLASEKYRVVSKNEEHLVTKEYDCIIICLPVQWLPSIDYVGTLRSLMSEHHSYYNYPAHYLRVACLFKRPFWQEYLGDGSYFRLDAFGGCCVYDESSRYPCPPYGVLNWLIAGSNAEAMSNLEDDLLITRTLESLPPELSILAKDNFLEGYVKRWIGTVNGQPGGLPLKDIKDKHLIDPKNHPHFIIVGDYLFDSTLNGLMDSADIASNLLLESLRTAGVLRKNPSRNYDLSPRVKNLMKR
ncbi:amine oxidase [Candidatus Parcubacteria bacterium]|nr:MAG: amine oxidase [Candidatus Parcubacteria bacterium]